MRPECGAAHCVPVCFALKATERRLPARDVTRNIDACPSADISQRRTRKSWPGLSKTQAEHASHGPRGRDALPGPLFAVWIDNDADDLTQTPRRDTQQRRSRRGTPTGCNSSLRVRDTKSCPACLAYPAAGCSLGHWLPPTDICVPLQPSYAPTRALKQILNQLRLHAYPFYVRSSQAE